MKPARQEILEKLKETTVRLPEMPDFESPVFHEQEGSPEIVFKKNLEAVNGNVTSFKPVLFWLVQHRKEGENYSFIRHSILL